MGYHERGTKRAELKGDSLKAAHHSSTSSVCSVSLSSSLLPNETLLQVKDFKLLDKKKEFETPKDTKCTWSFNVKHQAASIWAPLALTNK